MKRFNLSSVCPLCEQGARGVYRCDNKLIILCDECQAVWRDTEHLGQEAAIFPASDGYLQDLQCSIYGASSGWATATEIQQHGWGIDALIEQTDSED